MRGTIMIIDRLRDLIHRYDDKNAYLRRFLREPKGHEMFLPAMLGLRFVMLLGVTLRFGLNRANYADSLQLFSLVRISLVVVFLYILVLAALQVLAWPRFIARMSKFIQVLIDIALFSLLYFLTKDPESDLFILYFIPLLIAAEYFGLVANLCVLAYTSLSFAVSLWAGQSHLKLNVSGHFCALSTPSRRILPRYSLSQAARNRFACMPTFSVFSFFRRLIAICRTTAILSAP